MKYGKPDTLREFKAECIWEPRGELGLEGYQLGDIVTTIECRNSERRWFRVFPDEGFPHYYEVCSIVGFNRYFKEV